MTNILSVLYLIFLHVLLSIVNEHGLKVAESALVIHFFHQFRVSFAVLLTAAFFLFFLFVAPSGRSPALEMPTFL